MASAFECACREQGECQGQCQEEKGLDKISARCQRGPEGCQGQGQEQWHPSSPLPPPHPHSLQHSNSRKISKEMIGPPTDFRHLLHIDPSSDGAQLVHLIKQASGDPEEDPESDPEDPWSHSDLQQVEEEDPSDPVTPCFRTRSQRYSFRKSMIGPPTNFQHLDHIGVGERLSLPDPPVPDLPPAAANGFDGMNESALVGDGARTECQQSATSPTTTTTTTQHRHSPPTTLLLPPTPRERGRGGEGPPVAAAVPAALSTQPPHDAFDPSHFHIPTPPMRVRSDVMRPPHIPRQSTAHERTEIEEGRVRRAREEGGESRDTSLRDAAKHPHRYSLPPDTAPPPPPPHPPLSSLRKMRIGLPTNFQHLKHIDPDTADEEIQALLEEHLYEVELRGKERGRERGRERECQRRPSTLPSPPDQDPSPPAGRLRKVTISPPTNFQHVAHVGLGRGGWRRGEEEEEEE